MNFKLWIWLQIMMNQRWKIVANDAISEPTKIEMLENI